MICARQIAAVFLSAVYCLYPKCGHALTVDGYPIYPKHPRVWFLNEANPESGKQLLGVAEVRKLATSQNSTYFKNLSITDGGNTNRARNARVAAFRYVVSGLNEDAKSAYQSFMTIETNFNQYEAVDIVVPAACTFDWIYNWLAEPSNENLLAVATEKLRAIAGVVMNKGDHGPFSNITASAFRGGGLLHIGIALDDQKMVDRAYAHYRDELLKTANWVGSDGGWGEGLAYLNELYAKNMILTAELLYTATGGKLNLFTDENPFFAKFIPFTLFAIRPDFSYPHWSDIENFSPQYSHDLRENVLPLTFRFKSGLGQYLLSKLENNYGYQSMYEVLWKRDHPAAIEPDRAFTSNQERSALFRGIGVAIMRTGFSSNDTYVSFKASHWLSSHVHADAGHFEIFKNGPLAIDSGSYDEWGSPHMRNYYARSVAHNTLTIYDANESSSNFSDYVNDGGQRYWERNVFDDFREGLKGTRAGWPFHAAEINHYAANADFTYVCADLTEAYGKKVSNVTRQLFYFPHAKDALLVFIDHVLLRNSRFPVAFLLHYDGKLSVGKNDFALSNAASTLYGQAILPETAELTQHAAYEVNGREFPPRVELPESGKGRLEIRYPLQQSNDLVFITLLSVDQRTPVVALSKQADTLTLKFSYAGKPIQITANNLPQSALVTRVSVDGKTTALDVNTRPDSLKQSDE